MVIYDSYSRFLDVKTLKTIISFEVISHLKESFATHGIPKTLKTDNGTQYLSKEFKEFQQN